MKKKTLLFLGLGTAAAATAVAVPLGLTFSKGNSNDQSSTPAPQDEVKVVTEGQGSQTPVAPVAPEMAVPQGIEGQDQIPVARPMIAPEAHFDATRPMIVPVLPEMATPELTPIIAPTPVEVVAPNKVVNPIPSTTITGTRHDVVAVQGSFGVLSPMEVPQFVTEGLDVPTTMQSIVSADSDVVRNKNNVEETVTEKFVRTETPLGFQTNAFGIMVMQRQENEDGTHTYVAVKNDHLDRDFAQKQTEKFDTPATTPMLDQQFVGGDETPTPTPASYDGQAPVAIPASFEGQTPILAPVAPEMAIPVPTPVSYEGQAPIITPETITGETPFMQPESAKSQAYDQKLNNPESLRVVTGLDSFDNARAVFAEKDSRTEQKLSEELNSQLATKDIQDVLVNPRRIQGPKPISSIVNPIPPMTISGTRQDVVAVQGSFGVLSPMEVPGADQIISGQDGIPTVISADSDVVTNKNEADETSTEKFVRTETPLGFQTNAFGIMVMQRQENEDGTHTYVAVKNDHLDRDFAQKQTEKFDLQFINVESSDAIYE